MKLDDDHLHNQVHSHLLSARAEYVAKNKFFNCVRYISINAILQLHARIAMLLVSLA